MTTAEHERLTADAGRQAWHDAVAVHDFHADTGAGFGASHQTGWTGLVADVLPRKD